MPLVKSHKEWVGVLLAFAAVVAIACGGSATATLPPTATSTPSPTATPATNASTQTGATTPGAELTAEEAAYIEQVRAGWNEFHSKAGGFREAFGQLYEMKSRLFETRRGCRRRFSL